MKENYDMWASDAISYFISHMVQMKAIIDERSRRITIFFISHMVQMKGLFFLGLSFFLGLYIPHGSDERVFTEVTCLGIYTNFISHMVQMKVR